MIAPLKAIIAWIFLGISACAMLNILFINMSMRVQYGNSRFNACRVLTHLVGLQSRRIVSLKILKWIFGIIGICGVTRHFQLSSHPFLSIGESWPFAVMLGLSIIQFYGQARPGVVLVLGESKSSTFSLFATVRDACMPHRSICLLENMAIAGSVANTAGDCFRTTAGSWEEVTRRFVRCSIIIVIDLSTMTKHVRDELAMIKEEKVQYKTIILAAPLEIKRDAEFSKCRFLDSAEECRDVLKLLFPWGEKLPSDIMPIKNFHIL